MNRTFTLTALLIFLFSHGTAAAHKINLFAYNDDRWVFTETMYSNNTPVQNVSITVSAGKAEEVILAGKADNKGIFKFPIEKLKASVGENKNIIINATSSDGHNAYWAIEKASLPFQNKKTPPVIQEKWLVHTPAVSHDSCDTKPTSDYKLTGANKNLLEKILRLETEILALRRTGAKNGHDDEPGFREVFGGLGWILGICGLIAWITSKQSHKETSLNSCTGKGSCNGSGGASKGKGKMAGKSPCGNPGGCTGCSTGDGCSGITIVVLIVCLILPSSALAHFGTLLPSSNIITATDREVMITLAFCHPFEQVGMELTKPESFDVYFNGQKKAHEELKETTFLQHRSWSLPFRPSRPGVYQFVMTPKPYWEEGEDCFIIHYTKTIAAAFGVEEGWDKAVGLPVEIVPRTRPFGNYAGSAFTGQVLKDGKPLSEAVVEVEFLNEGNRLKPKSIFHITQTLKSDINGVFTINCPRAGWWSMAALTDSSTKIDSPKGPKSVELGGVLWIKVDRWESDNSSQQMRDTNQPAGNNGRGNWGRQRRNRGNGRGNGCWDLQNYNHEMESFGWE